MFVLNASSLGRMAEYNSIRAIPIGSKISHDKSVVTVVTQLSLYVMILAAVTVFTASFTTSLNSGLPRPVG